VKGIETAFQGAISRDLELKTSTKSGKCYVSFNVAVTTDTAEDGSDVVTWIRCAAFGNVAQEIAASGRKGSRCYVEGRLSLDTWTAAEAAAQTIRPR
jgi:single-strand DNA-binding protein